MASLLTVPTPASVCSSHILNHEALSTSSGSPCQRCSPQSRSSQSRSSLAVWCSQRRSPPPQRWTPQRAVAAPVESAPLTLPALKPENVRQVTSPGQFQREVAAAQALNRLLVVEFTRAALPNAERTHQALVELTNTTPDVTFLRVFADQSPELRALCVENDVTQIPSYVFIRNGQRVHQNAGMQPERLREEVLYYGQAEYPVRQLETVKDLHGLLEEHNGKDRLVVVQVTLNFCGPCVRVYPAVLQMSHKMAGSVVFARLFGDANADTQSLLTDLGIVEAPTFLFYRNNSLLGRYVGSGKGELVGEVLRYQGVECT